MSDFLILVSLRMADYAPSWGTHSTDGGFYLSQALNSGCYDHPDIE